MKKKDIIQFVITGVLIIVLIRLAVGLKDGKRNNDSPVLSKKVSNEQMIAESISPKKGLYARLEQETKNLRIRRNPFFEQILISDTGPYLFRIFRDSTRPRAIIADKVFEYTHFLLNQGWFPLFGVHWIKVHHIRLKWQ